MKQYAKYMVLCLMILVSTAHSGCRKFIELGPPKTNLVSGQVFATDATAIAALSNIYHLLGANGYAAGSFNSVTVISGFSADEFESYTDAPDLNELYENNILTKNGYVSSIWSDAYSMIYMTNALMEGLSKSTTITKAVKDQLTGEALFIRAFTHFYLYNLFGDVPYITTTDYQVNTKASRLPVSEVGRLIINDLKLAKSILNTDYDFFGKERVRVNKWAAAALLARVYLYAGNWKDAAEEASLVIAKSELYEILPLEKVFLKNSKEALWQIMPIDQGKNTKEGEMFVLDAKPVTLALNADFANGFEAGDLRRGSWVGVYTKGAERWFYPFKYKIKYYGSPLEEYSMVLRLAEQYLIRAEANAMLNLLPAAVKDVDVIRERAGLTKIAVLKPMIDKMGLLNVIANERKSELFAEWGHRWLDLKRTGKIDEELGHRKLEWLSTDALYPIPESQIKLNPFLIQNPGYN